MTREPGGTPLGEEIRRIFLERGGRVSAESEALLMSASRAQLVADVIAPALLDGKWVLTDRFATATYAYQGYGRGLPLEALRGLTKFAARGCEPDVMLLVDVPVALSMRRVAERAGTAGLHEDRLEREDVAFHERVRDGYLALAREDPRITIVDGTRQAGEVLDEAWRVITRISER